MQKSQVADIFYGHMFIEAIYIYCILFFTRVKKKKKHLKMLSDIGIASRSAKSRETR